MKESLLEGVYRTFMFFFVPLALVHLALPGRDPIRIRQRARKIRVENPTPGPVYLGPELGNKPYKAEVGPKRHSSHRRHGLAR